MQTQSTTYTYPIAVQYAVTAVLTLMAAALITSVALLLISKIGTTGAALFGSGAGALVLALGIGSYYMISKSRVPIGGNPIYHPSEPEASPTTLPSSDIPQEIPDNDPLVFDLVSTTRPTANLGTMDSTLPHLDLNSNQTTANTEIESLQGRLTTANTEIESLQGQLATANTEIESLQGQLATANTEIESLQGRLTTANTQIESLQGRLTTANTQIESLQEQLSKANQPNTPGRGHGANRGRKFK